MLSNITIAQITTDINGLLSGTITSVNDLSSGVDKVNSTITGTYPSGTYTLESAGTNTFSKVHNEDSNYTHYFRLNYSATQLANIDLSQDYTSGTDTLVNSQTYFANVAPNTFTTSTQFPSGINIVITDKSFYMSSLTSGVNFGIFDLGSNTITSTFADNMKMAFINFVDQTFGLPYAYVFSGASSGYSALTGNIANLTMPTMKYNISEQYVVVENPVFLSHDSQGHSVYGVYGLFRLRDNSVATDYTYNQSGILRISAPNYAIVTE
jgi:hypothetical protein